jgi:hypothetical protein
MLWRCCDVTPLSKPDRRVAGRWLCTSACAEVAERPFLCVRGWRVHAAASRLRFLRDCTKAVLIVWRICVVAIRCLHPAARCGAFDLSFHSVMVVVAATAFELWRRQCRLLSFIRRMCTCGVVWRD